MRLLPRDFGWVHYQYTEICAGFADIPFRGFVLPFPIRILQIATFNGSPNESAAPATFPKKSVSRHTPIVTS